MRVTALWDRVTAHISGVIVSSPILRSIGPIVLILAAPALATPDATMSAGQPAVSGDLKNGQPRPDALVLAQLLNPAGPLVALAERSFDEAFDQGLKRGEMDALEKEHPGILAELRKITRDVVVADLRADVPSIQRRYARFFADHFTPAETAELTEFYRTPTGAKIIESKFASVDVSDLVGKVAEDPNVKVTTSDIEAMNSGAAAGMWKGMNAEDIKSVLAFGLRPVARKLNAAGDALAQIETEIANEPDPSLDAAIDEATRKVYERYGLTE